MDSTTVLDIDSESLQEEVYVIWLSKLLNNFKELQTLTSFSLQQLHDIILKQNTILTLWYCRKDVTIQNNWNEIDDILLECLKKYKIKNKNRVFSEITQVAVYLGKRLKASSYFIRERVWSQIVDILKPKFKWEVEKDPSKINSAIDKPNSKNKPLNIDSITFKEQMYIIWLYKYLNNIKDLKTLTSLNLKDLHEIIQNKDSILALWKCGEHEKYLNKWDDIDNILLHTIEKFNKQKIKRIFSKINDIANYLADHYKVPSYYIRETIWLKIVEILEPKFKWEIKRDFTKPHSVTNLRVYGRPSVKSGAEDVKLNLQKDESFTNDSFARSLDFPSLKTLEVNAKDYQKLNIKHESPDIRHDQINAELQDKNLSKKIKLEPLLKAESEEENTEIVLMKESYNLINHKEVKLGPHIHSNSDNDDFEEDIPEEFISIKDEQNPLGREKEDINENLVKRNFPKMKFQDTDGEIEAVTNVQDFSDSNIEPDIVYEIDDSNDELDDSNDEIHNMNLNDSEKSLNQINKENIDVTTNEPIVIDIDSDKEEEEVETIIELEIVSDEGEQLDSNEGDINASILKELESIIANSKNQNDINEKETSKLKIMTSEENKLDKEIQML